MSSDDKSYQHNTQQSITLTAGRVTWLQAVREAIARRVVKGERIFTRQVLIKEELDTIKRRTGSKGKTPEQTLSRILQDLRDNGEIKFLSNSGAYRVTK